MVFSSCSVKKTTEQKDFKQSDLRPNQKVQSVVDLLCDHAFKKDMTLNELSKTAAKMARHCNLTENEILKVYRALN